jgi:hypothetical protein
MDRQAPHKAAFVAEISGPSSITVAPPTVFRVWLFYGYLTS